MNRRIPNGTYGGVGGRSSNELHLPDRAPGLPPLDPAALDNRGFSYFVLIALEPSSAGSFINLLNIRVSQYFYIHQKLLSNHIRA